MSLERKGSLSWWFRRAFVFFFSVSKPSWHMTSFPTTINLQSHLPPTLAPNKKKSDKPKIGGAWIHEREKKSMLRQVISSLISSFSLLVFYSFNKNEIKGNHKGNLIRGRLFHRGAVSTLSLSGPTSNIQSPKDSTRGPKLKIEMTDDILLDSNSHGPQRSSPGKWKEMQLSYLWFIGGQTAAWLPFVFLSCI